MKADDGIASRLVWCLARFVFMLATHYQELIVVHFLSRSRPLHSLGGPTFARRVVHLESTKKQSEEAFDRELATSKAALVAVEQK